MRTTRCLNIFLLVILTTTQVGLARGPVWKPERVPGSARLALVDVRAIVLPDEPSDRLEAAVEDLRAFWPRDLRRVSAETAPAKQVLVLEREVGLEGFFYRRDRTRVTLRAVTDEGLADALYALCRELLGLRWYWSGELGLEFSGESSASFPDGIWRERPAFVQRTLYPVNSDFGRRNGLNRKYSFNHNLARIFTREVFEASPEVFPEIGGERRPPRQSAKYDPQPEFTHPKTVELAAEAAREYLTSNPQANSFSFSINDNSLFDEGAGTEAIIRGAGSAAGGMGEIPYFRGRPNYTDLVFGFMNEVAEEVFWGDQPGAGDGEHVVGSRRGPSANDWCALHFLKSILPTAHCPPSSDQAPYLTALAYYWTEQSPSFELHSQVMPVLTSDRAQWHDPVYRAEDKALIERWAHSGAERIATWDYYFGAPYPYPRQFTQWIGESITYLHQAGVDVFFSQLPSVWGLDGPKAWLTAELLRDPEQEVAALLDEYYKNFFGPAAGPIRQFYETAEQTRNEREGQANWIKFYKDEAGIELFTPEILSRMRDYVDQAIRVVDESSAHAVDLRDPRLDPDRFRQRVRIVSEAFSYTESYAAYHRARVYLVNQALAAFRQPFAKKPTEGFKVPALLTALADYRRTQAAFEELKPRLAAQPMHAGFTTFNRLMQTDPTPLALAALARMGIGAIPSAEEPLTALSADINLSDDLSTGKEAVAGPAYDISKSLDLMRAWYAGDGTIDPILRNPQLQHNGTELRNFLGPELPRIDAWEIQYRASDGLRVEGKSGSGHGSGLRVANADIVALSQTFPVVGEQIYLLEIDASWQVSPDNRSWVKLDWKSISGDKLRIDMPLRLPNGRSDGQSLQFVFTAPVNAYDLQVAIVTNRQYEGDFLEIREVTFGRLATKP